MKILFEISTPAIQPVVAKHLIGYLYKIIYLKQICKIYLHFTHKMGKVQTCVYVNFPPGKMFQTQLKCLVLISAGRKIYFPNQRISEAILGY